VQLLTRDDVAARFGEMRVSDFAAEYGNREGPDLGNGRRAADAAAVGCGFCHWANPRSRAPWNIPKPASHCVRCAVAMAVLNSCVIAAVMSPFVVTEKNNPGDAQLCMLGLIWL
jgi:hypothetical protein